MMTSKQKVLKLRPYQAEAVEAIVKEWTDGRDTLAAMAVASGKTQVFLSALDEERKAGRLKRAIILSHRMELVDQPVRRIREYYPGLAAMGVGVVRAHRNQVGKAIISATVQTLGMPERLKALLANGPVTHLVVDECHHMLATQYVKVLERLQKANQDLRVLGVTATPHLGSGKAGLGKVLDSVAYKYSTKRGVDEGFLVPFRVEAFDIPTDFSEVPTIAGDYKDEAAAAAMIASNAHDIIVKKWLEHGQGRLTLAYAYTVKQAEELCLHFQADGVNAVTVHGGIPENVRRSALEKFRAGKIRVICNCLVFSEGTDLPWASCVVMARPTCSDGVYTQILGRVLRPDYGKANALVLDFAPRNARDLVMAADLLTPTQKEVEFAAKAAGIVVKEDEDEKDGAAFELKPAKVDPAKIRHRIISYLLDYDSRLAWKVGTSLTTAQIGKSLAIAVRQGRKGYRVFFVETGKRKILMKQIAADFGEVVTMADELQAKHGNKLGLKDMEYRKGPASQKTLELMKALRLDAPSGITQGEASQSITHEICEQVVMDRPIDVAIRHLKRMAMSGVSREGEVIAERILESSKRLTPQHIKRISEIAMRQAKRKAEKRREESRLSGIICKYCGKTGLYWMTIYGRPVLMERGQEHRCFKT